MDLCPSSEDVLAFTKQVEHLNLEVNTQGLKVEIGKLKRQRLRTTLKRVKQESIRTQRILLQLKNDNDSLKKQLSNSSNIHASEQARLRIMTHCCFSRLHQILISVIPYIQMSAGEHHAVSQLTYELLRAIQQIKSTADLESFVYSRGLSRKSGAAAEDRRYYLFFLYKPVHPLKSHRGKMPQWH